MIAKISYDDPICCGDRISSRYSIPVPTVENLTKVIREVARFQHKPGFKFELQEDNDLQSSN